MRRLLVLAVSLIALASCGKKPPPEPHHAIAPSRLIHQGGAQIWVMCDRGNLVYVRERAGLQVVAGGCPHGHP